MNTPSIEEEKEKKPAGNLLYFFTLFFDESDFESSYQYYIDHDFSHMVNLQYKWLEISERQIHLVDWPSNLQEFDISLVEHAERMGWKTPKLITENRRFKHALWVHSNLGRMIRSLEEEKGPVEMMKPWREALKEKLNESFSDKWKESLRVTDGVIE